MDWNRLFNAAIGFVGTYILTIAAIFAAKGVAGIPANWKEWLIFCSVALAGAYQKYSEPSRIISVNRKIWTEDERRAAQGLPPKRPIQD